MIIRPEVSGKIDIRMPKDILCSESNAVLPRSINSFFEVNVKQEGDDIVVTIQPLISVSEFSLKT